MMKNIFTRYKDILKIIAILIVAMVVFTLLHIVYVKMTKASDRNDTIVYEAKDKNYDIIKKELDDLSTKIDESEDLAFEENVYKVDFYENASKIYYNKMLEIRDLILDRLYDEDIKSGLMYDIDKFTKDLENDDVQQKRVYESTILASLNANISRYEKIKDKCYDMILDYRAILDK